MIDPATLQLFTSEEILDRLGQKRGTGCLHIFTPKDSANVFFKNGVVIAASNGSVEGVEVLKHILQWQDAHYSWQPDASAASSLKPLQIPIRDFLAHLKQPAEAAAKKPAESIPLPPSGTSEPRPIFKTIPSRGKSTGQIEPLSPADAAPKPTARPAEPVLVPAAPAEHTATKNFNLTDQARAAQDQALLQKHKLVLVSVDNRDQRFPIARVSGLVGRNPACDFTVPHASISRQHCLLQIHDRGLHVKDLGTTNGTKVNGIGLTEGYVNLGDKLTIGHLTFVVEKDSAAA